MANTRTGIVGFEPQKFFVGLIDFFSVLLPGSVLVYLAKDWAGPLVLGAAYPRTPDAQGVAVFLLASYGVGHFLFLVGSWLDVLYDRARARSRDRLIWALAWRGTLWPWWQRAGLWVLFKDEQNTAVRKAGEIKAAYLERLQAVSTINTFQWAKLHLAAEDPQALATVQRFEADSKFFRSSIVVLPALPFLAPQPWTRAQIVALAGLVLLALLRYAEQRHKSTNQAYWAVIALEGRRGKLVHIAPRVPSTQPTHAGGIVVRRLRGRPHVLLVEASKTPTEWVLPKGHVEAGETPRVTAVREVNEETGVWARHRLDDASNPIVLGRSDYAIGDENIRCAYFLMDYAGRGRRGEPHRRVRWMTEKEAVAALRPDELKEFVRKACSTAQA